jgi:hypothetical protein
MIDSDRICVGDGLATASRRLKPRDGRPAMLPHVSPSFLMFSPANEISIKIRLSPSSSRTQPRHSALMWSHSVHVCRRPASDVISPTRPDPARPGQPSQASELHVKRRQVAAAAPHN